MKGEFFQSELLKNASGSTAQGIQRKKLDGVPILFPININQQTRITTILSDMENEIIVLETKLAKAQQIKQGMMQNLLTGRIRLI